MSDKMQALSIVLPCYNPVPDWERRVLEGYRSIVESIHISPEVIIVNDGSSKAISREAVSFLKDNIPDLTFTGYPVNRGKGAALRFGVEAAKNERIIFTDIDFPYNTESFAKIWHQLLLENDVVIGVKDADYYRHVPKARVRISKLLRRFIGFFLNMPVTDTQCGLKGFNQKGKNIFLSTSIPRYLCDLEFVYKCYQQVPPLQIITQEVRLNEGVIFSKMNYSILRSEFYNFLKILIRNR